MKKVAMILIRNLLVSLVVLAAPAGSCFASELALTPPAFAEATPVYPAYSDLLAEAGQLLQDGLPKQAMLRLNKVDPNKLNAEQLDYWQILLAHYRLAEHSPAAAIQALQGVRRLSQLPIWQQQSYYQILATSQRLSGQIIASVKTRMTLHDLLARDFEREDNARAIIEELQSLPLGSSELLLAQSANQKFRGWVGLSVITEHYRKNNSLYQSAVANWRRHYPNHPGNLLLSREKTTDAPKILLTKPARNIAVLLPLSGRLAPLGEAVRDGFIAAQYLAGDKQNVRFFDSAPKGALKNIARQLKNQPSELIIGPLQKDNVKKFAHLANSSSPILALNYLSDDEASDTNNLYQFGLSPNDEIDQLVDKAWQQGHRRAFLITPDDAWGKQRAERFAEQWQALGGIIIDNWAYHPKQSFDKNLAKLLGIRASKDRQNQLTRTLGQRAEFIAQRRYDADMIFLVANAKTARQIKPRLTYYYADDLPVYATSSIYTGRVDPQNDGDLNGVIFCDIPWLIGQELSAKNTYQQLLSLWRRPVERYGRLYALGFDAYLLSQRLAQLTLTPHFALQGATGQLSLSQQRIKRQLDWAQFRHGKPQPFYS